LRDGWNTLQLKDVAALLTGGKSSPMDEEGMYVGMEHLDPGKRRISRHGRAGDMKSAKASFAPDDVLYGKLRPYLKKVAVAEDSGVCSTEILVFRARGELVAPRFLYYLLASPAVLDFSSARATGTRMPRIAPELLLGIDLPVPPLQEQRRIVDLLGAMDDAIGAADDQAAAAGALLRAQIDGLLMPSGNMADLPTGWMPVRLDDVSDLHSGMAKKGGQAPKPTTRLRPFLRAANVQFGRLDLAEIHEIPASDAEAEKFAVHVDDVLLVEGGNKEDVGRGWLWEGQVEACLHQNHVHCARPRTDLVEPRFLAYAICTSVARSYCYGHAKQTSNLASLNKTETSGIPIPLPPLEEQRRIAAQLDAMRETRETSEDVSARLSAVRHVLITRLLDGDHVIPDSYDALLNDAELELV